MRKLLKQDFITFLVIHFSVWSIIPLLRRSLPLDSMEAIMWGRYCDWGTNKHPPLSGFWANWFYDCFGTYGIYMLSQICILVGFVYIYKLAQCFLENNKALLAVMLLEGVIYYGFSSMEYNVNVLSLALWPLTTYYFYRAMQNNCWYDWMLTGLFAGLNVFNKYVSGVLLLCMALYMIATKQGRNKMKSFGPYLTFAVFMMVIAPHLWWLYNHDFYVLDYFIGRTGQAGEESAIWKVAKHVVFPLKFLGAQILFALLGLIVFVKAYKKADKEVLTLSVENRQFIKYMGIFPLVIFTLIALLSGIKMKSMWGFPVLYMSGIVLFAFYPFKLDDKLYVKIKKSIYTVMAMLATAAVAIIIFDKSEKINFQGVEFANQMEKIWQRHNHSKLSYVGGEIWYISQVSLYGKQQAKPIAGMNAAQNPWLSAEDIKQKGALVIFPSRANIMNLRNAQSNVSLPYEYKLEFKNKAGKVKKKTIYYAFISPEAGNE